MSELVTFGETMAAFSPGDRGPLRYVTGYRLRTAGAESNLAIGVAKLERGAAWISRLGNDEFGHHVRNAIRAEGVDTSGVIFDAEHRTGVMFKEFGAGETKVYYYRENSAASHLSPEDISEERIAGAKILHLTGITPVLSKSCEEAVTRAMDLADRHDVMISFDPNIRRKLWRDVDYAPLIRSLALRSRILLLGLDEAEALFGAGDVARLIDTALGEGRVERLGIKNGAEGSWVADRERREHIPPIDCVCIDPIGAGDAFNAGFLVGVLEGRDTATCGLMGNIAGGLATQSPGDIEGYPSRERMDNFMKQVEEINR